MSKQSLEVMACPACKGNKVNPIFQQDNFPIILFPIEQEKNMNVDRSRLSVSQCLTCEHMFIDDIDIEFNKKIYSDYYYLYPFSNLESMNDKYREPFCKTFDYLNENAIKGKKMLEIGCSDEVQFSFFLDRNIECTGVSPEAKPSEKVRMIDGFYEDQEFEEKFDYIVSRFNLEHIVDPDLFLSKVKMDLSQEGVVIIQVPNEEKLLKSGVLNIFAHEHTQYFNQKSLRKVLERNGFDVFLMRGDGEASLIACARLAKNYFKPKQTYQENLNVVERIEEKLQGHKDKKIIFYGAGLSLTALLYSSEVLNNFDSISIVDDNSLLWGKTMPYSNTVITSPDMDQYGEDTVVFLLLNSIYHENILKKNNTENIGKLYRLVSDGLIEV